MKYVTVKQISSFIGCVFLAIVAMPMLGQPPAVVTDLQGGLISRQAIAINYATHKVYAVNGDLDEIAIADASAGSILKVRVGKDPVAISVNPVTGRAYVANHGSGTVSVLDGTTNALLTTVDVGSLPFAVAANPITNKIYVSNVFSDVDTIIDGVTNATTKIKAGSADAITIDPAMNSVYLLHYETANLTRLNGTDESISPIPVGTMHLWGMALDAPAKKLYVTRIGNSSVAEIDEDSNALSVIPAGRLPCAVAVNSGTNTAYVANYGDNSVTVIDGRKHLAVATVHVGRRPQAIAVNERSNRIYVANTLGKTITVIDGSSNAVVDTLQTNGNPYALAIDSEAARLYVAAFGAQPFAVFKLDETRKHAS